MVMQPILSEEEPPTMEQTRTAEDQKTTTHETGSRPSVLAILCVFCASLGMMFFPAIVAIPLGICALKYINESEGRLSGRQMAVTGLCVAITSLSLWLILFTLTWLGVKLLSGIASLLAAPFSN